MGKLFLQPPCCLLFVAVFLCLAGCSSLSDLKTRTSEAIFGVERLDPPEPLAIFTPTITTKIIWRAQVGVATESDFIPAFADAIYATGEDGDIVKLNLVQGKEVWRTHLPYALSSGVAIGGGLVYVGNAQGEVYALDVKGKLQWKSRLSSGVLSSPQYFDGVVIVRTGDHHIYGLNANDGSRKWMYERATPPLILRSSAGVAVDGGAIYAGFAGGTLVALRADNGKLLWETPVAQPRGVTEIERITDITSLPVVEGDSVYTVAYQGKVSAIERLTGRIIWSRDISSLAGLDVRHGQVFITQSDSLLYALESSSGKTFWRQALLKNRRLTTPLALDRWLVLGDLEGYLHIINSEDGTLAARLQIDDSAVLPHLVAIADNTFIAQTRKGSLVAVKVGE
ncbi:MAG: outer membrane protein assembly factor BamB [Methylophilaceae bacterium]|nr:outer membrane protein assembly factor BamB [Methylophilaceae bacterium]